MIKKLKLFSVIFSTMVLFPLNALATSCKGTKGNGSSPAISTAKNSDENEAQDEIKEFIKSSLYNDKNASILELKELQENIDLNSITTLKNYLEILNNKLNVSDSITKVDLDNQVIIQGLKNKIIKNCEDVDRILKNPEGSFIEKFQEVSGKVLEVNEDNLIFSLKKFNLRAILNDISEEEEDEFVPSDLGTDDEEEKIEIFADSKKLKIYNFTTDLTFTLTYSSEKKHSISVKDYNLFVVLDKEKTTLLTSGISEYVKRKISGQYNSDTIPIYLNGEPDKKINEYFQEIIKKSNYDLTDQNNKLEVGYYLAEVFLPDIIFKNNDKDNEIKIWTKKIEIDESNKNMSDLKMTSEAQNQINFLKLFGDSNKTQQITRPMLDQNIKVENFLKNSSLRSYQRNNYYSLGIGSVTVNRWTIKGFSLNPVPLKFEIFIKDQILEQQITDLKMCLEYLTSVMMDSEAFSRNNPLLNLQSPVNEDKAYKEKYTVNIQIPRKYWLDLAANKILPVGKEWKELEDILNAAFITPAKQSSRTHFSEGSVNYKFTTKTSTDKDTLHFKMGNSEKKDYYSDSGIVNTSVLDRPINIYFIFNSFRINLTNDLLLKRRRIEPWVNRRGTQTTTDGNKIWFV